ncbi:unnamed protein product [Larinioides sclopetarius]|uniref:Uncharacterized protein n=1 Tax=Larinioides sclopetarius TaxID=280406 RepID=A0AAV2A463_9ARAC
MARMFLLSFRKFVWLTKSTCTASRSIILAFLCCWPCGTECTVSKRTTP